MCPKNNISIYRPLIEALISHYPHGITDQSIVASILYDVCVGLHNLHGQQKCHRNICASSIHIDVDTGTASLSQFHQLKKIPVNQARTRSNSVVPVEKHPFTDPLILFNKHASWYAGDIYSIGITAMQLAYGKPPPLHINSKNFQQITISTALYGRNVICPFSTSGRKKFNALIEDCCTFNLEKRITIDKLISHKFFTKKAKHVIVKQCFVNKMKSSEERIDFSIKHPYGFLISRSKTKLKTSKTQLKTPKTQLDQKHDCKIEEEQELKSEMKTYEPNKTVTLGNMNSNEDKVSLHIQAEKFDQLISPMDARLSLHTDEKSSESKSDIKNEDVKQQQILPVNELDTDAWLKTNGLDSLIPKMKRQNLTIKELLLCTENDIRCVISCVCSILVDERS